MDEERMRREEKEIMENPELYPPGGIYRIHGGGFVAPVRIPLPHSRPQAVYVLEQQKTEG